MELSICALSGEVITNVTAIPSETVSDLKARLEKDISSTALCEVKLLLDGMCLEEKHRLEELCLDATKQLYMIRSPVSAREILFNCPEVAFQLAKQYDNLGDQCAECIGTLFQDEHGLPRSLPASVEVLGALQQKLSLTDAHHSELVGFKTALTESAMEVFGAIVEAHGKGEFHLAALSLRHVDLLARCFVWLGLDAVLAVLATTGGSENPLHKRMQRTMALEFEKLPVSTLEDLRNQLPPSSKKPSSKKCLVQADPKSQLSLVLEKARTEAWQRENTRTKANATKVALRHRDRLP